MPIKGDRLRWPPRPGKRSADAPPSGAKRSPLSRHSSNAQPSLQQPNERDESAEQQATAPRKSMQQAHADIAGGQQDTDCRNQIADVVKHNSR